MKRRLPANSQGTARTGRPPTGRPATSGTLAGSARVTSDRPAPNDARHALNGGSAPPSPPDESTAGKGKRRFNRRWLIFLPVLGLVYLAFTYASMAVSLPSPPEVLAGAQGLQIYDRNGELIQAFGDDPGSGRVLPLAEVSPNLVNATVATEDAEFWGNPTGINPKGLARALYENLAFWEYGGFFQGSGGSSITQQLAKNLYIKPEDRADRSPTRKLNETLIAFELERRYSKQQILEWYLATLNYGNGAYGIESASSRYFKKPPSELTIAEAALLAGIPRGPNYYDPIANAEVARQRQEEVLSLMAHHGFIDEPTKEAALAETLVLNEGRAPGDADIEADQTLAPHFAQYVRDLLPSLIGEEKVEGDLKVTTTLDLDLQAKANEAVQAELATIKGGATNGALVAMDPATGQVLAMVGSQNFFRDDISGQVNNAVALNQPGSSIKPVTYLGAFMDGLTPNDTVKDEPIPWGSDGQDRLGNADGRYRGEVTLRNALGSSLNVPAVKVLEEVGLATVEQLATRLGVTTISPDAEYGSAFTLGAFEASLLDMTYVYSTFANQGVQAGISSVQGLPQGSRPLDPASVLKIETADGDVLYESKQRTDRIAPADDVSTLTNVLADNQARASMFGLNSPLNFPRPAAVKSGSSDETRDAWTIGFTPQLVTGVWVGNVNNDPIPGGTSTATAAPIWHNFMLAALEGEPVLPFPAPKQENAKPTATPRVQPSPSPAPTDEPDATQTPRPGNTPQREETNTPRPQNTPRPTNTPPILPTNPLVTSTPQIQPTQSTGRGPPGASATP
jgi:membrane peptidoglycan carboxypeptidase